MDEVMSSQFQELAKMNSNKRVHEKMEQEANSFNCWRNASNY